MSYIKRYEYIVAPHIARELNKYKHLVKVYENRYKDSNHLYEHFKTQFAPGHFYSPYPDLKELVKRKDHIFNRDKKVLPGIDLREKQQLKLLNYFKRYYSDLPYLDSKQERLLYHLGHHAYSHTDAVFLYSFIRYLKPKRIIEIGSGYSSMLMLDINELFFDNKIDLTFIEPFPKLLKELSKKKNPTAYKLISKPLYEVDRKIFTQLQKGDILFIDSTHVAKAGGDINQIYFEILPFIKPGVIIHIHDIFYPFEYPVEWVWETRAWNEIYIVRAFLYNNPNYEVLLFNNFLNLHHKRKLKDSFPLTQISSGGSLWLRKIK